jgi:hypothetical protein
MSSNWDAEIAETWPDAEKRAEKRARFLSRLDKFLEEFVECDGGWAKITDEDHSEMHELIGMMIDLKVQRDPDGDRTIQYATVNRRKGRMETFIIPYPPRDKENSSPTLDEQYAYSENMSRIAAWMAKTAASVSEQGGYVLAEIRQEREDARKLSDALAALEKRIRDRDDFVEVAKDLGNFSSETTAELQRLYRQTYADIFDNAEAEAMARMDEAAIRGDPDMMLKAKAMIEDGLDKFGPYGFALARNTYNGRAYRRRRALVAAAKEANPEIKDHEIDRGGVANQDIYRPDLREKWQHAPKSR